MIGGGCAIREKWWVGIDPLVEDGFFFGGRVCLGRGYSLGREPFLRLRGETVLGVYDLVGVEEWSLLIGGSLLFGGCVLFGGSILFRWGN